MTDTKQSEVKPITECKWIIQANNPNWVMVQCIQSKVNYWKMCRRKHVNLTQAFQSCPYCKGKVHLMKQVKEKKNV